MNNTRAERDDPAVHQASSSRTEWTALREIHYYIILSLLILSRIGQISLKSNSVSKFQHSVLIKSRFLAGLNPGHCSGGSGIFWLNSVFWHINAFSTVSLTSPGHQTVDSKPRGCPEWQRAREQAFNRMSVGLYPCRELEDRCWT